MFAKLVIIENSSLVFLTINPEGLSKFFETKKQKGFLAAYGVVGTQDPRKQLVHVAVVNDKGGVFDNEKVTTVFTYIWE